MGNHSTTLNTFKIPFNIQDWQQVPLTVYTNIKDPSFGSNFQVYAHNITPHLEIEKYDLYFNSQEEFYSYYDTVRWRNSNRHLVQVKHIREPLKSQFCSTFEQSSLFVERIPIRLVEIQDISIEEGLCILYCALQGFDKIYERYGYIEIEPQMLGFTREGFVRVWLNRNFSKHYPENIYVQNKNRTYECFIESILLIIEKLVDFQDKPIFTKYLTNKRPHSPFNSIISSLENYATKYQISVPRYLSSIRNICFGHRQKRSTTQREELIRKRSKAFQNRINSKKLELSNNIGFASSFSHRPSLEALNFNKKQSVLETERHMSVSCRTPSVRFHYRNSTVPLNLIQKSQFTPTAESKKTMKSCFKKKKSVVRLQKWELDPEIAADLANLHSLKK